MKVHIQRKHGGIRQQPTGSVSLSTSPEFTPSMSNLGTDGRYRHHHEASSDYIHLPSELYSDKLEESPPLSPLPTPTPKEKDASHKLFEPCVKRLKLGICYQGNFNPFLLLLVLF